MIKMITGVKNLKKIFVGIFLLAVAIFQVNIAFADPSDETLEQIKQEIKKEIYECDVLMSTYDGNLPWSISLVMVGENELSFIIGDHHGDKTKFGEVLIEDSLFTYDTKLAFPENNEGILNFGICFFNDDPKGVDADLGVWSGTSHFIPLSVHYELIDGSIIPIGISSARGTVKSSQCNTVVDKHSEHMNYVYFFLHMLPMMREAIYEAVTE